MMQGKKIARIKVHVGVDILGLPHYVFATTADVGDREGAIKMVKALAPETSTVRAVLAEAATAARNLPDPWRGCSGPR